MRWLLLSSCYRVGNRGAWGFTGLSSKVMQLESGQSWIPTRKLTTESMPLTTRLYCQPGRELVLTRCMLDGYMKIDSILDASNSRAQAFDWS